MSKVKLKASHKQARIIREDLGAEPTLIVSNTSNYTKVFDDDGSGASMDVTIYRPTPSSPDYFILGDYAQPNYNSPTGTSIIVKVVNDDPNNPLLVMPQSYTKVWDSRGSDCTESSFWYPVAPDGYISIGYVANAGNYAWWNPPALSNYRCVRRDLIDKAQAGSLIWNDKGSGADADVSLYRIDGFEGSFVAQSNYDPYSGQCFKLILK
jgi:hypothetical protein